MSSPLDNFETKPLKICVAGDSGTGKTSALLSLILQGYKVRAIDVDNGIDIILSALLNPKSPYYLPAQKLDLADAFRFETVNHKMITMELGKDADGTPKMRIQPQAAIVWPKIENLAHEWIERTETTELIEGKEIKKIGKFSLGRISSWGTDTVLVLDSSTFAGTAALFYVQQMNQHLGADLSGNQWRRDVGGAQDKIQSLLRLLCSDAIKCHVIVNTHVNYMNENIEIDSETKTAKKTISSNATDIFGVTRAYPTSIGRALGPVFGRYFNNVLEMKLEGTGKMGKRKIYTVPTGSIAVKTSDPWSLNDSYDHTTGLAEIFAALRRQPPPTALLNALKKPALTPNIK